MLTKKILFICPYPFDVAAGQRLKFEPHFSGFKEKGLEIKIDSFMSKQLWDLVYVKGHIAKKIFWTIAGLMRRTALIFSLRKYDSVYIFMNVFPFGPPLLERIYRLFSRRIIYDLEDNMLSYVPKETVNWIATFFRSKAKYEFLISTADEVIVSSPLLVEKCKEITKKENVNFIPPTLNASRFTERPKKKDNKKVVIGWTGTQGTRVYLEGLIPTLEKLHHLCPFKLMVVGNFEMSHPFLDLEVVKWSSEKEIKQLHNFDIGIYPLTLSDWVGGKSGLKALQYMAVGIPPVSSAVGNVVNFINNNEDGILINNEEEWLINLESLIKDQEKRENIGKKAREKFLREFSQDKIFDQYFSLITIKK